MRTRKAQPEPLKTVKRGRPDVVDRDLLKTRTMTVCLTPALHNKLKSIAKKNNQKPAAMVRILIETGVM